MKTSALLGRKLNHAEVLAIARPAILGTEGAGHHDGLSWNTIHLLATLDGESGFYSLATNYVLKDDPDHPSHLSVDLGIAQFNTRWYPVEVMPMRVRMDPALAIPEMVRIAHSKAIAEGKPWRLDFEWWNAHDLESARFVEALGVAHRFVNDYRIQIGLSPI